MSLVNALRTKDTRTLNSAVTHSTSLSAVLDFFAQGGAMRNRSEHDIVRLFIAAYGENPTLALRALFYLRDARQGQGERRLFRVILRYLASVHPRPLIKNLGFVPHFGRWDDLLTILDMPQEGHELDEVITEVCHLIAASLQLGDNLAAKWMPRESGAKRHLAKKLREFMGLSPKEYRRLISDLSKTVEQQMCANQWGGIVYEHVPSVAMSRYRKAFPRHTPERWALYIEALQNNTTTVKASVLYPYEIVGKIFNSGFKHDALLEEQWKRLPEYGPGNNDLVVVDTSGSMMHGQHSKIPPIYVALSLGLYLAERAKGVFKNAFITFSARPQLQYVTGKTLSDRIRQMRGADWGTNTDLRAVFALILNKAVENQLPESDMPKRVLIVSDMEFDAVSSARQRSTTNFESFRELYAAAGYDMPELVFWNVDAKTDQAPVQMHESGTALISGCSPNILRYVLGDEPIPSPEQVMLQVLTNERYGMIEA